MRKELICLIFSVVLLPLSSCATKSVKQGKKAKAEETNDRLGEMVTIPVGSFLMGNSDYIGFRVAR